MQLSLSAPLIWMADQAVDFRLSINGLSEYVRARFERNPREGVYIFYNRQRTKLKILAWHGNGFVLLLKRLEQGRFVVSENSEGCMQLAEKQLSWLLAGLDWFSMSQWNNLEYDNYY